MPLTLLVTPTQGIDKSNLKILIPPPKPLKPGLPDADDTARDGYTAGITDDITSDVVWALTGAYSNTTTQQQTYDAAARVGSVVTTITSPDGVSRTVTSTRTGDAATTDITPYDADKDTQTESDTQNYTYTIPVDLVSLFGAANVVDGDWTVSSQGANYIGEAGSSSDPLTITLDRTAPLRQDANGLILKVSQGTNTSGNVEHTFSVPAAASEDNGAVYLYEFEDDTTYITGGEVVEDGSAVMLNKDVSGFVADYAYYACVC